MGGFANNAPIVTDGLVFYVDAGNSSSYPGSGTDWGNLSGSATATLTNSPTHSSNNGGYFSFDGTNDHVATTYDATGKINLTFCVWLNIDNFNITNGGSIFDQSTGSTGFGIRTISSDTIQVFARNSDASSLNYLSSAYTGLSTGTWYYVCVKLVTNSITTYLNGAVNATHSATLDTISVDSSNNMEIGGRNDTTDGHLDGSIALVQIYEKALSNDEVLQNYNALKNRFV